ncbi:THUMP domain-containing protein 1 [Plakobranchus ocellatus]|uniref:THUMP domain-containing protein 1 n=1 Tax=Plakobranchus ocellatus TaxID=259542 RepID=A0AAV4CD32_9GAST|nr:THUMP domain-containing protein 1 [Plakobranchus ocellatus]
MPLEFIDLVKGFHPPTPEDRGFLINLTRARWNNSATTEAMNLLRAFAEPYFEMKCPESREDPPEDREQSVEKEDNSGNKSKAPKKSYRIQFAVRDLFNNNVHCFLACNLADPEDFAHYMFSKLAEDNDFPKPKLPFRILPVQRICEAMPKAIEQTLLPLLEETLAKDGHPHRFSLINRNHLGGENVSHSEAMKLARNCVWATNPNCVQCLKYQDYAVIMDIIEPLFFVGVVRDFQRLANYKTWLIQRGIDDTDAGPDSEDDISDDPNLSEEEEKRRKLRIKRKRRAQKMNMSHEENEVKKCLQGNQDESKGVEDDLVDEDDLEENEINNDGSDTLNGDDGEDDE